MLKNLSLKNFILVESCHLVLDPGFTVLTGETGAGKSTILHALKLLLGAKLDPSFLRLGEKKGFVLGEFLIQSPRLEELLSQMGISVEDSSLFLLREISSDGKSRCFIQDRPVPLSSLQRISSHLLQIVDQNSYQELRAADTQRGLLDSFGGLEEITHFYALRYKEWQSLLEEEKTLDELERQKEREGDFCLAQEEELQNFTLQEGEEESLFQEYSLSFTSQEVSEKTDALFSLLQGDNHSIFLKLREGKKIAHSLLEVHEVFKETEQLFEEAQASLEESLHLLRQVSSTFDLDPQRVQFLEQRLHAIDKMKKKYGPSPQDWQNHLSALQEKTARFNNLEEDRRTLAEKKCSLERELDSLSQELSCKRKDTAVTLSSLLRQELQDLNMGQAQVEIRVEKQARCSTGEDKVSFWLAPNKGEAMSNVKEGSSGGELSRLLLALKVALAKKNLTPTLIFDEIDANVGGETSRMIGEKLLHLSLHRQILCITHFPQVAKQANLHLRVQKQEQKERTLTTIESIEGAQRHIELLRMLGLNNQENEEKLFEKSDKQLHD